MAYKDSSQGTDQAPRYFVRTVAVGVGIARPLYRIVCDLRAVICGRHCGSRMMGWNRLHELGAQ